MNLGSLFHLENAIGIPLMTPDMEALVYLYLYGPIPSQSLQMSLRISPSGFYNVQRRLKKYGLIEGQQSDKDMRMTLYDLAAHVRKMLEDRLGPPAEHLAEMSDGNAGNPAAARYRFANLPWRSDLGASHS